MHMCDQAMSVSWSERASLFFFVTTFIFEINLHLHITLLQKVFNSQFYSMFTYTCKITLKISI